MGPLTQLKVTRGGGPQPGRQSLWKDFEQSKYSAEAKKSPKKPEKAWAAVLEWTISASHWPKATGDQLGTIFCPGNDT